MHTLPLPSQEQLDEYFDHLMVSQTNDREFVLRVIARAHQLVSQNLAEVELRKGNPFLQSLWDEYQVALKLVLSEVTPIVNT